MQSLRRSVPASPCINFRPHGHTRPRARARHPFHKFHQDCPHEAAKLSRDGFALGAKSGAVSPAVKKSVARPASQSQRLARRETTSRIKKNIPERKKLHARNEKTRQTPGGTSSSSSSFPPPAPLIINVADIFLVAPRVSPLLPPPSRSRRTEL